MRILGTFAQVFVRYFRRTCPQSDIDKRRFVDPLIAPSSTRSLTAKVMSRNSRPAGDIAQLGISGEIAHQDDAIITCHTLSTP